MEYKDLAGRMEHKVRGWRQTEWQQNPVSKAWYRWMEPVDDDPATVTAGPSGVDQVDRARLELAKSAARRAMAAGFGRSTRPDGKIACTSCTKCNLGRPDLCLRPVEPIAAKAVADQLQADRVTAAMAVAADNARVVWQQQVRLGMDF